MSRIALITVSYFSGDALATLLPSVPGASRWPIEVIIVDNSDDPDEFAALATFDSVARRIDAGGNLGYGGAVNRAAETLDEAVEWIVVCNPDVVLGAGSIDAMIAASETRPDAGVFGPRIRSLDGSIYPSARRFPSLVLGVGHAGFSRLWATNPWTRRYRLRTAEEAVEPTDADWLSGSCLLISRAAFTLLGGFDERFFMYFEDVDLARRAAAAGIARVFVPGAEITHEGAHATRAHSGSMSRAHHQSAYRYLAGEYPRPWHAPLRAVLKLGLTVRSAWVRRGDLSR